jgi:hypothetical protein
MRWMFRSLRSPATRTRFSSRVSPFSRYIRFSLGTSNIEGMSLMVVVTGSRRRHLGFTGAFKNLI